MSLRARVLYEINKDIDNEDLLRELRLGEPSAADISDAEAIGFLAQWLAGVERGLLLLAEELEAMGETTGRREP